MRTQMKAVVWCLLAVGLAGSPLAAADLKLTVTADHADAIYKRGEKVTFTASITGQDKPVDGSVKWTLTKDGVEPPLASGDAALNKGSATITGELGEPGFLQCAVEWTPADGTPLKALCGAAVEPLAIQPSLPPPADFDAYWTAQKEKLARVPVETHLTPVRSNVPGVDCFDLQAPSVGNPLSAYLARPTGAAPHSLPAMLLPHGAGVMSSYLGVAAEWAKAGFLALDFNVQGLPNGKPHEFYTDLAKGPLLDYYRQGREDRDTFFFHDGFLRVLRALDALAAQPEWDGKILIANGRSQGGGQAIAAAGLDPRVTFLCAEIPALCDHAGITVGRVNGWPRLAGLPKLDPAKVKPPIDDRVIQCSRYYDAVNLAQRVKSPAFFTVGFIDRTCAPTTVYAAYNQIPGPKKILNLLPYGHQRTPEGEAGVRAAVEEYLKNARQATR